MFTSPRLTPGSGVTAELFRRDSIGGLGWFAFDDTGVPISVGRPIQYPRLRYDDNLPSSPAGRHHENVQTFRPRLDAGRAMIPGRDDGPV